MCLATDSFKKATHGKKYAVLTQTNRGICDDPLYKGILSRDRTRQVARAVD